MEVNDVIAQEVLYKVTVVQEVLYMDYLSVRPLVLSNTLSHIWDRLNLPFTNFHHCIQETYTYRPVFTVGQSPSPLSQV